MQSKCRARENAAGSENSKPTWKPKNGTEIPNPLQPLQHCRQTQLVTRVLYILLRLGSSVGSHSPRCLWAWCSEAKPPAGCRAPHGQVSPIEAGLWWKFSSWRLSPGACRPWAHRSWCQIKAWNSVKFSCPHKLVKKRKKADIISLGEWIYLKKGNSNAFRFCPDSTLQSQDSDA